MRLWAFGLVIALASCGDTGPHLVSNSQVVGDTTPKALTAVPGDAERGSDIFVDRERGHCVLCHAIEGLEAEFQGNVGPDLSLVGDRLSAGQLRLRIADYQIVRPGTLMPSYYRIHDLYQVAEAYQDDPVLTAQEVEDLVSYLSERR
ncbi:MAG: sulfur oxidation c-type cytochrome SoxX [Henriciella sp.]